MPSEDWRSTGKGRAVFKAQTTVSEDVQKPLRRDMDNATITLCDSAASRDFPLVPLLEAIGHTAKMQFALFVFGTVFWPKTWPKE
jgi:hypothetical protein